MDDKIQLKDGYAQLKVNPEIYGLSSIKSSSYVFLDRSYIVLDGDPSEEIIVNIKPKEDVDAKKMALEFYNELMNYEHYSDRVKENNEIIKRILQGVLFSSDPGLMDEEADEASFLEAEEEIEDLIRELEEEEE